MSGNQRYRRLVLRAQYTATPCAGGRTLGVGVAHMSASMIVIGDMFIVMLTLTGIDREHLMLATPRPTIVLTKTPWS
jgi:hypothetical protein